MSLEHTDLDPLQVFQATTMLLSHEPTNLVDALFFHGRSFGDTTNLFKLAADFQLEGRTHFIALFNNEGERNGSNIPYEANPGKTFFRSMLIDQKVDPNAIVYTRPGGYHTRMENDDFLDLSQQLNWKSGVILTQPHQLLRAMLGMLKAMQETNYFMDIHTLAPKSTPWFDEVSGSQGVESKLRVDHIKDEFERIAKYQQAGQLASFEDLFQYLAQPAS